VTKVLNGTGDTWNRVEQTARSIAPGDWQVFFDATADVGLGPPNRVTVLVERRDENCTLQQTIIDQEIIITQLLILEYETVPTNPGQVDFNAGDILTVRSSQTSGNQNVTLRYADSSGSNADSRLLHPDTLAAVPASDNTNFIEAIQTFIGVGVPETAEVTETIQVSLGVSTSESASLGESVFSEVGADSRGGDDDDDARFPPAVPETDEEIISTPSQESDVALEPLGENLVRLWHFDNTTKEWSFYDPSPAFATVNVITEIVPMQAYWVRIEQDQVVVLNGRERFLFAGWNLIGW
jgi:hypothetical protein